MSSGQCGPHKVGLRVLVTERGTPSHRCGRTVGCTFQAGHGGECSG